MKITIATLTMVGLVGVAAAQPKVDPRAPIKADAKADVKVDAKAAVKPDVKTAPPKTDAKLDVKADAKLDAKTVVKMETPKPPVEVADMAKLVVGTWRCTGSEINADGTSAKMTATVKTKLDLDKWWISETMDVRSARGSFKMVAYSTYAPGSKKWRRVSVDSMGNQYVGTSDGAKDGVAKLDWNIDTMGPMGAGMFRDHLDLTTVKTGTKASGEISMDKGKTWKPVYEMTCKK
ncbi:MAG: hypothetical protein H0T89_30900 [Deltaproteobacteria bacterium]|nr:hypothetical protein [Deltaproteobacteria bacterium]MDQ3295376.1 hypothetical protein [Myxococcota bacterium]